DNLTGLPNRELLADRLETSLTLAREGQTARPSVIAVDLDRFKQINAAVGLSVGDSILLTLARRLNRLIKPQDTLSRVSGDQFALIVAGADPDAVMALADAVRRSIATPVTFADREIAITASLGVVFHDAQLHERREDMLKDAEIAMAHAKRSGGNRVEVFRPAMRGQRSDRMSLAADMKRGIEQGE
ncbi:MAG: GGDEF domain-containing protein, partial [Bryobacterales bacterium]|nr:GGDEF domain-containing protein [Bryobacterales bacterium]